MKMDGSYLYDKRFADHIAACAPAVFLHTVISLWGEAWRPELTKLLARHGHHPTRQTLWNWKTGNSPVPEHVEMILMSEWSARKSAS